MAEKKETNWDYTPARKATMPIARKIHSAAVHVGLRHPKEIKKELKRMARLESKKKGGK